MSKKGDAQKKQNGEVAPDVDQDGKMINPHNPDFITKVPWYLGSSGPTLKHHNIQKVDKFLTLSDADQLIKEKNEAQRVLDKAKHVGVFKKGACRNCGATTHKEKDCIERPRSSRKAAWKSGLDIASGDVTLKLEEHGKVSYSAKRDQWQGYDPKHYTMVVERFERLEEDKRKFKQLEKEKAKMLEESKRKAKVEAKTKRKDRRSHEEVHATTAGNGDTESDSDSDSDSDYDSDEDDDEEDDTKEFIERDEDAVDFQGRLARQGGVGGNEMKITARNLRIREDTPKYLRNLALDSAHYDPKSRSMRMNPLPNENPEDLAFAGDNFIRYTGDAVTLAKSQILCWEMQERGEDVDLISNPSQAELMMKTVVEKKKALDSEKKKAVLDKYGGSEHLGLDPRIKLGQSEAYSEYSWDGRIIKGVGKLVPRSKYEEDVYVNNHTAVWGSYFNRYRACWGYRCCHSLLRNSYCTGEAGRVANDAANSQAMDSNQAKQQFDQRSKRDGDSAPKILSKLVSRSDVFGESSGGTFDEEALSKAIKRQEEWSKRDSSEDADDRRRSFNSMKSVDVKAEDMEAYRLKKSRREDPMASFQDTFTD